MDSIEEYQDNMDIGDLVLDGLEKAVQDPEQGITPSQQVVLLKEAIIKTGKAKTLSVGTEKPSAKIHETVKK